MFLLAKVQICLSLCQCRVSQAFFKPLFTVSLALSQFGEQNFFFAFFEKEDHLKNALGIFLRL